jgi:hypothetical protein
MMDNFAQILRRLLTSDTSTSRLQHWDSRRSQNHQIVQDTQSRNQAKIYHPNEGFPDVFSWSYEDLKVYDTKVIQHVIPIKDDHKPFKQKLRRINPLLLPLIEKEVRKLFDAKIIVSLRFSKWVANLVPVRKKSGEIRLCVDF